MKQETGNYVQQSTEKQTMANVPQRYFQSVAIVGETRRNTLSYTTRR